MMIVDMADPDAAYAYARDELSGRLFRDDAEALCMLAACAAAFLRQAFQDHFISESIQVFVEVSDFFKIGFPHSIVIFGFLNLAFRVFQVRPLFAQQVNLDAVSSIDRPHGAEGAIFDRELCTRYHNESDRLAIVTRQNQHRTHAGGKVKKKFVDCGVEV